MDDRSIHSAGHASHGPLKQMLKNALGSDTAADLSRVLKNEQDDFTTILYTLQFSFAACLLMVVVFVCIRALFPQAHVRDADEQEKSYSHAASSDYTTTAMESSGIFETAWVWWSVNVSAIEERRLIELLGLDGVMMLESLQMGKKITCLLACALIPLLCPLYYFYYQRGDDASKSSLLSIISVDTFTASTTSQGQTVLSWALAACAWLVVLVVTYVLDYHQQIFLARRFDWLRRMPYPRATTLLVENIPPELRSDQALKLYFCRLFSDESIESAYIVRKTNTLRRWVENERKLDIQLKEATLAWEAVDRDPSRRPRVGFWNSEDAIELYTRKLEEASSLVDKRRQDLDQAVEAMDLNVCSSTGFVTFYSRRLCTLASRQQYRTDINEMVITDPPDTNDVNYDDLMQHTHVQLGRRVLTQMLLFTLFMIWAPMIITVQSFTGLEAFKRVFPWLDSLCEMYPTLEHLLEGVMSTAALSGFMYLLPIGLMLIFRSLLPLKAGTWAQLKLQEVLFIFQILFVVIMTSVAGSVFGSLGRFIDDPKDVLTVLCLTLPTYYGFYIQFFMMACNLRFVSTLRSWQVTLFMFSRFILGRSPQLAKQDCEPEDQDTDGMGARMSTNSLYLCIAIVFSTCCPVLLVFAFLFFAIAERSYGYLLVVETRKPDTGGSFWVNSINHVFYGLTLFVFMMFGLVMATDDSLRPALLLLSAICPLGLAYHRFCSLIWETLPFEAILSVEDTETELGVRVDGFYRQPECEPREPRVRRGSARSHWARLRTTFTSVTRSSFVAPAA